MVHPAAGVPSAAFCLLAAQPARHDALPRYLDETPLGRRITLTALNGAAPDIQTRQVMAWQEQLALETLRASKRPQPPSAVNHQATLSILPLTTSPGPRGLTYYRRRRASGDRSEKLSPIDNSGSSGDNLSHNSSPDGPAGSSDGSSPGDDSTESGKQGPGSAEGALQSTEGAKAVSSSARQLGSMVDESYAEVSTTSFFACS